MSWAWRDGSDMSMSLSGAAGIVGVGASSFERVQTGSALAMAGHAFSAALGDAQLEKGAIDGLIVQIGSPRGCDYDTIAEAFGLDVRYCGQSWAHGRFTASVIIQAVLAIQAGLCEHVACLISMKNSSFGRLGEANNPFYHEQFREGGGPHGEEGHIGMNSPIAGAAMGFEMYCRRYQLDRELLATIPITFRDHARLNPEAVMQDPLDFQAYQQSRSIIDPLRLLDCSLVGDGAICLIVSGRKAVQKAQNPVWITGVQGIQASRDNFIFAPRGLGMAQQSQTRLSFEQARSHAVYAMAGVTPEGIDTMGVYDSFSPLPLYILEDFGFCEAGTALSWIQDGRIARTGELPLNTGGGQLSHAQMNGWGQIRELVLQLRGGLEARQVKNATTAMWASVGADAIIFQRD